LAKESAFDVGMHSLSSQLTPSAHVTATFFILLLTTFTSLVHTQDERLQGLQNLHVEWVPIVDRTDIDDSIQNAFKHNLVDEAKVRRISKMLNNSLALQEEEVQTGTEHLNRLRNSSATTHIHVNILLTGLSVWLASTKRE
jgi:hypothetical protein